MSTDRPNGRSARADIRAVWVSMLQKRPSLDVHVEADRITEALLAKEDWVRRYAAESLKEDVLSAGILERQRWRDLASPRRTDDVVEREQMRAALVADVKREIKENAAGWMLKLGTKNTNIDLLQLGRKEVLTYAEKKKAQSLGAMHESEWLRRIGERMTDTQRVADAWGVDELEQLRDRISVSFVASLDAGGTT